MLFFVLLQVNKMPKPMSEPSSPSASRCSTPVYSDTEDAKLSHPEDDDEPDSEEEREELGLALSSSSHEQNNS